MVADNVASDLRDYCVYKSQDICKVLEIIESRSGKVALVVDSGMTLLGTVTDGDIRRALLAGITLDQEVARVMNSRPVTGKVTDSREALLLKMETHRLRQLPLVDDANRLVDLVINENLSHPAPRDNWVVLMAGGEGRRLRPLTNDLPKPMLPIGSKPILEIIINSFISAGFRKFFISVNYKAELVESYFGDGHSRGIEIKYIKEDEALDTAGSLSLLGDKPSLPFFVMNCDILTKVNFIDILDFHREHGASATMCVSEYKVQVPYGVVDIDGCALLAVNEKPVTGHFINAGIYVLEPCALDLLSHNQGMTMPKLFEKLLATGAACNVFPIREYWLDIGQIDDFRRANVDYSVFFDAQ